VPPPSAEPFAARIFLGPALRTQPDRRLVKLVREGYEGAFEEIVRRYRKPLDRFAAGFVGNRSEDVTQDAFSKALLALRGSEKEIELRPWLYRIVRNTALNDLRDGPPPTAELGEGTLTGPSAAVEAERRAEIAELIERLQALPEPQRAAIVMRELEGLSHEEIAAGLGVSGGAARQAIHRARTTLRDGFGLLVPLPLLRLLFDQGVDAAAGGAAAGGAAAAAGAAAGGGGTALGGIGAVGALKVGLATAVLAGSVGAGVAVEHHHGGERRGPEVAEAATFAGDDGRGGDGGASDDRGHGSGGEQGDRHHGDRGPDGDDSRHGGGPGPSGGSSRGGHSGSGGDQDDPSSSGGPEGGYSGHGPDSGGSGSGGDGSHDDSRSGSGPSGGSSGASGDGSGKSGTGSSGDSGSKDGSGTSGGSGSSDSGSTSGSGSSGGAGTRSGSGSDGQDGGETATVITPPPEPAPEAPSGSGSSSGGSGSGSSGDSGGSGDSGSSDGSGSSGSGS
jgi:RNA polymerase sigma factor (sigma-70 family)